MTNRNLTLDNGNLTLDIQTYFKAGSFITIGTNNIKYSTDGINWTIWEDKAMSDYSEIGAYFLVKLDICKDNIYSDNKKNVFISKDELCSWYNVMCFIWNDPSEFIEINNLIIVIFSENIFVYKEHKYKGERLSLNENENTIIDKILLKRRINNIK
jgi:hypothetical protein